MTVTYAEYLQKRLCEVVLLGSHDAGITNGNSNTQTQTEGIFGQAQKGARFFDIRIAAFSMKSDEIGLFSYHDATKKPHIIKNKTTLPVTYKNASGEIQRLQPAKVVVHATVLGSTGEGLSQILRDSKRFVTSAETATEFIILKFDKCTNWIHIASLCRKILEDDIYVHPANSAPLNERLLEDLKGKVIVLFDQEGYLAIRQEDRDAGILKWKNLYNKSHLWPGSYEEEFPGLIYYGKGGVSAKATFEYNKILKNQTVQTKLMEGHGPYKVTGAKRGFHAGVAPEVIGLMYWTTTGTSALGIEARNNVMWERGNQELLVKCTGLAREMAPSIVNSENGGAAGTIKTFMPNIIMVDFVTEHKGRLVKELNTKNAESIREIINNPV